VTLYEKSLKLGGQLHLAGGSPGREEFLVLADDLTAQLADSDVRIVLNTDVDGRLLMEQSPDTLILATGGSPITPDIEGAGQDHVVQAWDVLKRKWVAGSDIVVIGGGAVGVETALMIAEQGTLSGNELKFLLQNGAESIEELQRLSAEGTKTVTMVELQDKVGNNFGKTTKWTMLQDVARYGINTRLQAQVKRIEKGCVVIETAGEEEKLPADTVILAVGTVPFNPLGKAAAELNIISKVVGDAQKPATVLEATHQGFRAGRSIS